MVAPYQAFAVERLKWKRDEDVVHNSSFKPRKPKYHAYAEGANNSMSWFSRLAGAKRSPENVYNLRLSKFLEGGS